MADEDATAAPPVEEELRKALNFTDGFCVIVGTIIGSGIFSSPGTVVKDTGSVRVTMLAWATGGVLAILGTLCYAELGVMMPQTGGEVVYLRESYGGWAAFTFSWAAIMVIKSGSISIICIIFARFVCLGASSWCDIAGCCQVRG